MGVDTYNFCAENTENWDTHKFSGERISKVELTENMIKGICAEKHVVNAFKKLGIPISHTDFNAYEHGSGCDIWNHELGIYGEIKDTAPTYKFTDEFFNKKILARFPKKARFKFLALPSKYNLQKDHLEILKRENIRVIEFGKQVKEWSNQVAQTLIKKLYYIKLRVKNTLIKPLFKKPTPVLHKVNSDINNLEYNGLNNIIDSNVHEINNNLDLIRTRIDQLTDFKLIRRELKSNNIGLNRDTWNLFNYIKEKPAARPRFSPAASWSGLI